MSLSFQQQCQCPGIADVITNVGVTNDRYSFCPDTYLAGCKLLSAVAAPCNSDIDFHITSCIRTMVSECGGSLVTFFWNVNCLDCGVTRCGFSMSL